MKITQLVIIPLLTSIIALTACDDDSSSLSAPKGFTATRGTSSEKITLSWSPVSGAKGYEIYRKGVADTEFSRITTNPVTGTSYDDSDITLRYATIYQYQIRATAGGKLGKSSAIMNGSKKLPSNFGIPQNVVVTPNGPGCNLITWDAVNGADGYNVFWINITTGVGTKLNTGLVTGTSFSHADDSLICAKAAYGVEAIAGTESSCTSNAVMVRGDGISGYCGLIVDQITATEGVYSDRIELSWTAVEGATGYNIYRTATQKRNYQKIGTTTGLTFTDADPDLPQGINYYYYITVLAGDQEWDPYSYARGSKLVVVPPVIKTLRITLDSIKCLNIDDNDYPVTESGEFIGTLEIAIIHPDGSTSIERMAIWDAGAHWDMTIHLYAGQVFTLGQYSDFEIINPDAGHLIKFAVFLEEWDDLSSNDLVGDEIAEYNLSDFGDLSTTKYAGMDLKDHPDEQAALTISLRMF